MNISVEVPEYELNSEGSFTQANNNPHSISIGTELLTGLPV
jgi:hypothetical protein